jgi:hypothetical protein
VIFATLACASLAHATDPVFNEGRYVGFAEQKPVAAPSATSASSPARESEFVAGAYAGSWCDRDWQRTPRE